MIEVQKKKDQRINRRPTITIISRGVDRAIRFVANKYNLPPRTIKLLRRLYQRQLDMYKAAVREEFSNYQVVFKHADVPRDIDRIVKVNPDNPLVQGQVHHVLKEANEKWRAWACPILKRSLL